MSDVERFIIRYGKRVSVSPLVVIVSVAIILTLAVADLPRPVLLSLLALQVTVILLGVRPRRFRSRRSPSDPRKAS